MSYCGDLQHYSDAIIRARISPSVNIFGELLVFFSTLSRCRSSCSCREGLDQPPPNKRRVTNIPKATPKKSKPKESSILYSQEQDFISWHNHTGVIENLGMDPKQRLKLADSPTTSKPPPKLIRARAEPKFDLAFSDLPSEAPYSERLDSGSDEDLPATADLLASSSRPTLTSSDSTTYDIDEITWNLPQEVLSAINVNDSDSHLPECPPVLKRSLDSSPSGIPKRPRVEPYEPLEHQEDLEPTSHSIVMMR